MCQEEQNQQGGAMGRAYHKNLIVWQKADVLVQEIYCLTKSFPKEETYGVVSQLRRAALSIVLNLVEGCARQGRKELKHFVSIALGSQAETEYLLELSWKLSYLSKTDFEKLEALRGDVGGLLWGFFRKI